MSIAILYIGLGKYLRFFEGFYTSCEKYFLNNLNKEYYIFTDQPNDTFLLNSSNINIIKQDDLGWPGNTLFRFKMFLSIKEQLIKHEYIFFFNGNTLFKENICTEEILPTANESYLVGLSWINVYTDKNLYPYERNHKSLAYIPLESGKFYYQGGLNGGRSKEYLELIENCNNAIEKDLSKNIIARFHDESHINKYLLDKKIKVLNSSYGCPEERNYSEKPKIIFRDKNKYLGERYINKMKDRQPDNYIKRIIYRVKNTLFSFKKIEIIYLQGGLGNQMFQYAFYLNRKLKKNNVNYDTTIIDLQKQHNGYELERVFNIKEKNSKFRNFFFRSINYIKDRRRSNIFFISLNYCLSIIGINIIKDTEPSIYFNSFNLDKINMFLGYWQSDKYFVNIKEQISSCFQFNENLLSLETIEIANQMKKSNSVSLHIRRGDYLLNNKLYGNICTIQYYNKAIQHIQEKISNPTFYIFSDDIEWAKANFHINNSQYINHNKGENSWQDMFLMSNCKHNIIANSSFSWWGAYLNSNPSKIIISPSKFVNSSLKQDIVSDSFIKIKV